MDVCTSCCSAEEAVRCRELKVQEMQEKTSAAHSRALSAKENERSSATELACTQEQLSVKQQSLSILKDKRLQLTQELTDLRKAEAETRKELNVCRCAPALVLRACENRTVTTM